MAASDTASWLWQATVQNICARHQLSRKHRLKNQV